MDLNRNTIIRILLITIGLVLFLYSLTNFFNYLEPSISSFMQGDIGNTNFEFSIIINLTVILAVSFLFLYIGLTWNNIFKHLSKILISFAIFFLTFAIFMQVLNSNSEEITNSIQPSIDYILAYSLDDVLMGQLKILDDATIKVQVSENTKFETFYVSNLTQKKAELFSDTFDLSTFSIEEKIIISKIFINSIYEEMLKADPNSVNIPVSLSFLKSAVEDQGVDIKMFKLIDIDKLENTFPINNEAYINVIISENEEILELKIGTMTNEEVELIWNNLGLSKNISYESKEKITKIFLSEASKQKEKLGDVPIPIQTISAALPMDIKSVLNYDLFTSNISKRVNSINQIRTSCELNEINSTEICDAILLTKYNNLMQNLDTMTKDQIMPINISFLENYNSLEKVEIYFENSTSSWKLYIFLFILFNILAYISYWAHFKIFKRELIKYHIQYFITKHNLLNMLFTVIIFAIIYYYIATDKLIETLIMIMGQSKITFIKDIAIYNSIKTVFASAFYITFYIFLINLILYITFFILQKKEIEKLV